MNVNIFTEFVVTHVLHIVRISNVESTVCDDKERKMVNFRLGKKRERWNIQMSRAWDKIERCLMWNLIL